MFEINVIVYPLVSSCTSLKRDGLSREVQRLFFCVDQYFRYTFVKEIFKTIYFFDQGSYFGGCVLKKVTQQFNLQRTYKGFIALNLDGDGQTTYFLYHLRTTVCSRLMG